MHVRVLGPLAIEYNGVSIVPTANKPRQILALLALRPQHTVSVGALIEEVWGDAVPRSAATTLQTYILQLRRRIAKALDGGGGDTGRNGGGGTGRGGRLSPKEVLATSYGGYRLVPPLAGHDLTEFQDLSARGVKALEAGDARAASHLLGTALLLWRGPALADVPHGPALELEAIGMEEARLTVLEQRIEADLCLGRHRSLLPELRMLSARHPLNENLCAQLMTALYRAGSPWRALEEFRRLRVRLDTELGVEPTPGLQRLHLAVLNGDPGLEATAQGPVRYAS
ncbi:AfsR/SARP family transcriptional regulator [Streptomyces sp. NPDC093085]|uniref:AfsR/SARP family transcriptional regulator n=1 Tax=Streptomyces sp. NPDC093085 TaxID=3155068 RepID=UPI003444D62C